MSSPTCAMQASWIRPPKIQAWWKFTATSMPWYIKPDDPSILRINIEETTASTMMIEFRAAR
jgi:hypothetical protein